MAPVRGGRHRPGHAVGVVLCTVAIIGFLMLVAALLGWLPQAWWEPLAIGSSLASLAAIAIFPSRPR